MKTDTIANLDGFQRAARERPVLFGQSAFSDLLLEYGKKDPRVCYVGVDTIDPKFARHFPGRTFDVGICEQDEMTFATGLAKAGMIPVVQGWSPFTPMRNYDQLRTSLARHKANVKIISSATGLANCSHGATHHDMESVALFRTIPNLILLSAMDEAQFAQAFHVAMEQVGPVVLLGPPLIYAPGNEDAVWPHEPEHEAYSIGGSEMLREGEEACLIGFGPALHYAWAAAGQLAGEGLSVGVLNAYSLKPIDQRAIQQIARRVKAIVTVEEQTIIGGLGSAVAEIIAENRLDVAFKRMGIPDQFVEEVGDWTDTRRGAGLCIPDVMRTVRHLLGAKR